MQEIRELREKIPELVRAFMPKQIERFKDAMKSSLENHPGRYLRRAVSEYRGFDLLLGSLSRGGLNNDPSLEFLSPFDLKYSGWDTYGQRVFVIQQEPTVRTISFSHTILSGEENPEYKNRMSFRLAFPYIIFIISLGANGFKVRVACSPVPITFDSPIYYPNLPNINYSGDVCMAEVDYPRRSSDYTSLVKLLVGSFWGSLFNSDLRDYYLSMRESDRRFRSLISWQEESLKDPLFVLKPDIPWIRISPTLRDLLNDLGCKGLSRINSDPSRRWDTFCRGFMEGYYHYLRNNWSGQSPEGFQNLLDDGLDSETREWIEEKLQTISTKCLGSTSVVGSRVVLDRMSGYAGQQPYSEENQSVVLGTVTAVGKDVPPGFTHEVEWDFNPQQVFRYNSSDLNYAGCCFSGYSSKLPLTPILLKSIGNSVNFFIGRKRGNIFRSPFGIDFLTQNLFERLMKLNSDSSLNRFYTSGEQYPGGTRYFKKWFLGSEASRIYIVEQPPQIRKLRFSKSFRSGRGYKRKERYELAFPYVLFVAKVTSGKLEGLWVYYSKTPFKSFDNKVFYPGLTEVGLDHKVTTSLSFESEESLLPHQIVESAIEQFWNHRFIFRDVTGYSNFISKEGLSNLRAWQRKSSSNPSFPLKFRWLKEKISLRKLVYGLFSNASSVPDESFQEIFERELNAVGMDAMDVCCEVSDEELERIYFPV